MWSRYTLSVFVDRKKPGNIIDALMTQWIGTFGVMKAIMTDNGGELTSDEMREITSISSINNWTVKARHKLCIFAGQRNQSGRIH